MGERERERERERAACCWERAEEKSEELMIRIA